MKISILDRIVVRPGRRDEFLTGWRQNYLPGARARGLTLAGICVVPPQEFLGLPSDITIVWTVPDHRAFFGMRGQAGADPAVAAFWTWCDALIERRERHVGAALESLEVAGEPRTRDTAKEPTS